MASAKIFRINYKSDFILTLTSDAGWMTPFCIKFWTGAPSQAYYVVWDGETYTHCAPVAGEPTKLLVQFDDHHLPIGDLKFQIGYHFTVADFPNDTEDEVINPANIVIEMEGEEYQVMLDFTGETAPEIQFSLPAYANEAQRIANEQQRIANEEQRIANEETRIQHEESRIAAEQTRQRNEQQRINQEQARVNEYAGLKADAVAATGAANDAAALANQKAQLAADKAALAQAAADFANAKAQLAADKAALADAAAMLANQKAALAQQKAEYAQEQGTYSKNQGDYAKEQGDYSKAKGDYAKDQGDYSKSKGDYAKDQGDYSKQQGDYAKDKGDICAADHQTAVADHQTATADHQTAAADHQTAIADHNQAGNDHTRAESDHTRAESDHAAVEVYVDSLGAFDISAYHATGGELAKYADLTAALGTNGANIPDALRKGGMSVKFVQSSDNNSSQKYVQYRFMLSTFTAAQFANVANWQGVDAEPTAESINLVESGGVDKCNFVYDSIIEKKNDIINLFDKTKKSSDNYVKRTDGTTQSNSQFFTTDYIPIDSDGLYAYQGCTGGTWLGYACYNANKVFTHGASSRQATFQEGDAYARFSGYDEDFDTFMVIKGTSADQPSSYVPYGYKAGKLKDDTVDTGNIKNSAVTNDKLALNAVKNSNMADDSVSVAKLQSKSVTEPKVSFLEKVPAGNNLLNPNDPNYKRGQNYGINKNTGAAGYANLPLAFGYTGFIPVSTEGLYCNCNANTGTFSGAVYNKNKEFIRQLGTAKYTYVEGDAYVRWTLRENPASPYTEGQFMINEGTTGKEYEVYTEKYIIPAGMIPPIDIDVNALIGILIQEKIFTSAIDVFLPDKLYAVRGDKLQLFFQGMAKVVNPEMYNYLVACSVGNQYHRYFEYNVPANAELGNKEFVIKIKDNNRNVLGTAQSVLKVVDAPSSPSSNINVLCVGDSITSNGVWPAEMQRRLKGTGGTPAGNGLTNITFVGSMLKEGVNFEGHSGWAWSDYTTEGRPAFRFYVESGANVSMGNVYTNNGFSYTVIEISDDNSIRCSTSSTSNVPQVSGTLTLTEGSGDPTVAFTQSAQDSQNPFWDSVNNKMSFVNYADTYCNGVIDVVYVLLGGNKMFTSQTNNIKTFIDTLHTEFPNAKVKLTGGYVPSMKLMMPGYGASGTLYADTYNVLCTIKEQCRLYQEIANLSEYSSFVEYLDVACQLDSDYNMAIMQKAVNTRNSETEPYAYNTIHASPTSGYLQIADAAYRNFVGNFCQD